MTLVEVQLKDRTLTVTFEHPWKIMQFRGQAGVPVKVTNCTIVENRPTLDGDKKPRVRFLTHGFVKWPIVARRDPQTGAILRGSTTTTLPTERLDKDRARRVALTRALWPNKDPQTKALASPFTREERTRIWAAYNTQFSTQKALPPATPPLTPMPAVINTSLTFPVEVSPSVGVPGIVNKVVAFPQHHRPSPFAFWSPSNQTVH